MGKNIIFVSSEVASFAKTGGLADVSASLPVALKAAGANVSVFMPFYRHVSEGAEYEDTGIRVKVLIGSRIIEVEVLKGSLGGVAIYFIKCDEYFDRTELYGTPGGDYFDNLERFILFSRGVLEATTALKLKPDVFHLNDWQSALIAPYLKSTYAERFKGAGVLLTIHNIAYQGSFSPEYFHLTGLPGSFFSIDGLEFYGKMSLLKAGIVYSDVITTVSEAYSREIQTIEYGFGLEGVLKGRKGDLYGVLNGADYDIWDPSKDEFIIEKYDKYYLGGKKKCREDLLKEFGVKTKDSVPVIGIVSRLADQKGFDILSEAMEEIMKLPLVIVILGTGEHKYHELYEKLHKKYPEQLGVKITFDNTIAHKIEAGSDIFLMPSRYEPCGLNQMYSLRYGTIPLVRATGGLDDTITDFGEKGSNGFKFTEYSSKALLAKIKEALAIFKKKTEWMELIKRAMKCDFSWERSAKKYIELYKKSQKNK